MSLNSKSPPFCRAYGVSELQYRLCPMTGQPVAFVNDASAPSPPGGKMSGITVQFATPPPFPLKYHQESRSTCLYGILAATE